MDEEGPRRPGLWREDEEARRRERVPEEQAELDELDELEEPGEKEPKARKKIVAKAGRQRDGGGAAAGGRPSEPRRSRSPSRHHGGANPYSQHGQHRSVQNPYNFKGQPILNPYDPQNNNVNLKPRNRPPRPRILACPGRKYPGAESCIKKMPDFSAQRCHGTVWNGHEDEQCRIFVCQACFYHPMNKKLCPRCLLFPLEGGAPWERSQERKRSRSRSVERPSRRVVCSDSPAREAPQAPMPDIQVDEASTHGNAQHGQVKIEHAPDEAPMASPGKSLFSSELYKRALGVTLDYVQSCQELRGSNSASGSSPVGFQ